MMTTNFDVLRGPKPRGEESYFTSSAEKHAHRNNFHSAALNITSVLLINAAK